MWYAPALAGADVLINPYQAFYGIFDPKETCNSFDGKPEEPCSKKDNMMDFETVLLHEMGHVLGLGHASEEINSSLMSQYIDPCLCYRNIKSSSLSAWAINRLYGQDGELAGPNDNPDLLPTFSSIPCESFDVEDIQGIIISNYRQALIDRGRNAPFSRSTCENCIQDVNEDGIDCGIQACKPCNNICTGSMINQYYQNRTNDIMSFTATKESIIIGNNVNPNMPEGIVTINDKAFRKFEAGKYIEIKPGTEISESISVFEINDCECPDICKFVMESVFITPNCDGDFDYLAGYINGATSYSIKIANRWNNVIYEQDNVPIEGNYVRLWDGTTNTNGSPKMVSDGSYDITELLFYNSCKDYTYDRLSEIEPSPGEGFPIEVLSNSECMLDNSLIKKAAGELFLKRNSDVDRSWSVFPNPTEGKVQVYSNSSSLARLRV